MTDIVDNVEDALETARDAAGDFLNIGERNAGHVALGVAVTVGLALAATLFASRTVEPRPPAPADDDPPLPERPRGPVSPNPFSTTPWMSGSSASRGAPGVASSQPAAARSATKCCSRKHNLSRFRKPFPTYAFFTKHAFRPMAMPFILQEIS